MQNIQKKHGLEDKIQPSKKRIRFGEKCDIVENTSIEESKKRLEEWYKTISTVPELKKSFSEGEWCQVDQSQLVLIAHPKGNATQTMGIMRKSLRENTSQLYLYPEEAVYLLDQGLLQIKYQQNELKLEDAIGLMVKSGVPWELYVCYSKLKKMGYVVRRHSKFVYQKQKPSEIKTLKGKVGWWSGNVLPIGGEKSLLSHLKEGEDVEPQQICELLMKSTQETVQPQLSDLKYQIVFDVWKPKPNYSRKNLPSPSFAVCVSKYEDCCPSSSTVLYLAAQVPGTPVYICVVDGSEAIFYKAEELVLPSLLECKEGVDKR